MMIDKTSLKQENGISSTNYQSNRDIIINNSSPDYLVVKEMVNDLFMINFIKLKGEAAEIAKQRAEDILIKFLENLVKTDSNNLGKFNQPALLIALYNIQKEYACNPDPHLADLLVDLLTQRVTTKNTSLSQIILDEALTIIGKVPSNYFDLLTIMNYVSYEDQFGVTDKISFEFFILNQIVPYIEYLECEDGLIDYLEYAGCTFSNGGLASTPGEEFYYQFQNLFSSMSQFEFKSYVLSLHSEMHKFYSIWEKYDLCNHSLSPVGRAIGLANERRHLAKLN